MKLKPKEIDDLTERIEDRRKQAGLTYSDLARETGIETSQVNKICHGRFKSMTANVMQICTRLGIVGDVVDEDGYARRLSSAVVALWDQTPDDGVRLLRLLDSLKEIRASK